MYLDISVKEEELYVNLPRAHSPTAEILGDPVTLLTLSARRKISERFRIWLLMFTNIPVIKLKYSYLHNWSEMNYYQSTYESHFIFSDHSYGIDATLY